MPRVSASVSDPMKKEIRRIVRQYPALYGSQSEFLKSAIRNEILSVRHGEGKGP